MSSITLHISPPDSRRLAISSEKQILQLVKYYDHMCLERETFPKLLDDHTGFFRNLLHKEDINAALVFTDRHCLYSWHLDFLVRAL